MLRNLAGDSCAGIHLWASEWRPLDFFLLNRIRIQQVGVDPKYRGMADLMSRDLTCKRELPVKTPELPRNYPFISK
jgi:hypothetical protein